MSLRVKLRFRWWSWQNWRKGYKFGPVQRCRRCDHTTPYHNPGCWDRDDALNAYDALVTTSAAEHQLLINEMQAIKEFLQWFAHRHGTLDDMRTVLRDEAHLPESVIEWVMS